MGVDWFTCESCGRCYNDCGYYSICDLCHNHCGCISCEYDGQFDYMFDENDEYVLCIECMPKKDTYKKVKVPNKKYLIDCKHIEEEIKNKFKPDLEKGETDDDIDYLNKRRDRRKNKIH